MDPALHEAIAAARPGDELEAVAWLEAGAALPPLAREVARFGDIVTCRIAASAVGVVRRDPAVRSLKASRRLRGSGAIVTAAPGSTIRPRAAVPAATGAGVVVAVLDWGFDLGHPNLRRADGSTRVEALWDQRGGRGVAPYGYGAVHRGTELDDDLAAGVPHRRYRPWSGRARSAHGTHVADIAAGSGAIAGSAPVLVPDAGLVLVHLATHGTPQTGTLGDSVRLLEALDFVRRCAGERPWVANLSLGRTGGDHSGQSLVECAMDALLEEEPGRAIVQSGGNYFATPIHADGLVAPGGVDELDWWIADGDPTGNELEIWYAGRDRFVVDVVAPDGAPAWRGHPGERGPLVVAGVEVGRGYHRRGDPTNGDNQIDVFLDAGAPAGRWRVVLRGLDLVDGRYHAWIERDAGVASSFAPARSSPRLTVGTIANGRRTLVVGAYDDTRPDRPLAPFSSSGPTRDGRRKPDLLAPGVAVVAAAPMSASPGVVAMSGTSMAAPHVTAAVARLFSAVLPLRLPIAITRAVVLGTAAPAVGLDPLRRGSGYLDATALVAAGEALILRHQENPMSFEPSEPWRPTGVLGLLYDRAGIGAPSPADAFDVSDGGWPEAEPAPRFKVVRGGGFHTEAGSARLDPTLLARMTALCDHLVDQKLVTADIVFSSGVRDPAKAHKWSTAYFIRKRGTAKSVPFDAVRALPCGRDLDGNLWFQPGWTDEDIVKNAERIWSGALAAEGYAKGDPRRLPNTGAVGMSNHLAGNAMDVTIRWVYSSPWDPRAVDVVARHGLARPVAGEPWHFELAK
jgi:subtilisin family serine protease